MAAAFIRSDDSPACGAAIPGARRPSPPPAGHRDARHGATPLMRARRTGAPPAAATATETRRSNHAGHPHSTHFMLAQDL